MMNAGAVKLVKTRFERKLRQLLMKKSRNGPTMTKAEYLLMMHKVEAAKQKMERDRKSEELKCLKKYDVIQIGRMKKLIVPREDEEEDIQYFVHTKELFMILHKVHVRTSHGSTNRMMKELKSKYKNITREIVRMYVKVCTTCARKAKKNMLANLESKKKTKGHIEIITMCPWRGASRPYKVLMMYHDYVSGYDVVRPLVSNRGDQIAKTLVDVFALFGIPDVLHSMVQGGFVKKIVQRLIKLMPGLQMDHYEIKTNAIWRLVPPGVFVARNPRIVDTGEIFMTWSHEIVQKIPGEYLSRMIDGKLGNQPTPKKYDPYRYMFVRNVKRRINWSHLAGLTLNRIKNEELYKAKRQRGFPNRNE